MRLLLGNCLDKLKEIEDNSVDSIVTDPPYELGFMGKTWDNTGIAYNVEMWKECLRVLKPGGHLLSFGGTRTYHRMAVAIEDAGFEVRDMIEWIYGSGFPKSMNIGKALDKLQGNERKIINIGISGNADTHTTYNMAKLGANSMGGEYTIDKGTSEFEGWGTALKPAHEPICMARKPLSEKTVVANCLKHRTGGINIDDSRVTFKDDADKKESTQKNRHLDFGTPPLEGNHIYGDYSMMERTNYNPPGRFPANLILDEEAGKILDEQSGISKSSGGSGEKSMGALGKNGIFGEYALDIRGANIGGVGDTGGASRFFYCPKASKKDRDAGMTEFTEIECGMMDDDDYQWRDDVPNGRSTKKPMRKNFHPTVKPTDLMLYLIRMVTPKGGTTLDPFMGSGSSGKAAVRGGFDFIGIEMQKEYMEIAEARIQSESNTPIEKAEKNIIVKKEIINKFFNI